MSEHYLYDKLIHCQVLNFSIPLYIVGRILRNYNYLEIRNTVTACLEPTSIIK
jgi:hypothetical protein